MRRIKTNSLGARVLSGFLSLLMVVSACPVTAFADDDIDNNPVETTAVIVDENGVHVDGEDDNGYTIIIDDESDDENVDSIPADEDAEDQNTQDVDTPPNIDDSSDDGTDNEKAIVEDQTDEDTSEDAEPTEETDVKDSTEPTEDEETAEPEYEYSVTLPSDKTVSEGDTLDIEAEVVAKVTVGDETSDVDYTFEFYGEGVEITTKTATSSAITFNNAGEYTIVGKLFVDDEEVASDEMTVKVNPVVVFDHYFTDIDESLVETSDLLVKTNDSSVFTKNTNVVSNFDDVYIIECSSVEEARYLYSYYVDKVDSISDLSKVISIATDKNDEDVADLDDLNDGNDVLAQLNDAVEDTKDTDYSDYIALIDTGADADVNFSVVGDDTADSNGHGTRMLDLIKAENPDAKVMSIKVFNGSTTDAASVYAGIKLAIENDVKVINLSLVGSDVEKNAIVKDVIQEAIDNNIVVIGAAGNYNLSASKFIPGCVEDAIIIGAANEDGTKKSNSNYNADYYVVADSTSEATAVFTGLYTSGALEDSRLLDGDFNPTKIEDPTTLIYDDDEYSMAAAWANALGTEYYVNPDGTVSVVIPREEGFVPAGSGDTQDAGETQEDILNLALNDEFYGTCSFSGSNGSGKATSFSATDGKTLFPNIANSISGGVFASCDRYWGDSTDSAYAKCMSNGTVSYKAWVSSIDTIDNGAKLQVTFDILFSDNGNFNKVVWTSHRDDYEINVTVGSVSWKTQGADGTWGSPGSNYPYNGNTSDIRQYPALENGKQTKYSVSYSWTVKKSTDGGTATQIANGYDTIAPENSFGYYAGAQSSIESSARSEAQSAAATKAKASIHEQTDYGGVRADDLADANTYHPYQTYSIANRNQIYHGRISAWHWRYTYLTITKNVSDPSGLTTNNSNYDFSNDTKIAVKVNGSVINDVDGHQVIFDPSTPGASQTFTLDFEYANKAFTYEEISCGYGYKFMGGAHNDTFEGPGKTKEISLSNEPMFDPISFSLRKVSDKTGTDKYNGDIDAENTIFEVRYYDASHTLIRSWRMKTIDHVVRFGDPAYIETGNPYRRPDNNNRLVFPIGYYEIEEVTVPHNGSQSTGLYKNSTVYTCTVLPRGTATLSTSVDTILKDSSTGEIIYQRDAAHPGGSWNSSYSGSVGQLTGNADDTWDQIEEEEWLPFGILKTDTDLDEINNNAMGTPEGDGSYEGAKYQLFYSDNSKSDDDVFKVTYNNPNGSTTFHFGDATTTVDATDGFDRDADYSIPSMRPVLDQNNNPVYITCGADGYGETAYKFPYDNSYVLCEVHAPEGYAINTHPYTVALTDWGKVGSNGNLTRGEDQKLRDHNGHLHDVVKVTETANRDGAGDDAIYRYGFALYKKDLTSSNDALDNA